MFAVRTRLPRAFVVGFESVAFTGDDMSALAADRVSARPSRVCTRTQTTYIRGRVVAGSDSRKYIE